MDHMKVYLVAGALAVVLAGTYVIWGPPQKTKRKRKVPGLMNLGNSCFLNAVIQAFAACPVFIYWLEGAVEEQKNKGKTDCDLCIALLTLLKDLNSCNEVCSAAEVINALQMRRWVISNEEQDAHELLHVLTATLEEEIIDATPVLSLLEVSKLEASKCANDNCKCKPFLFSPSTNSPKSSLPCRGLLSNQIICKQCGYKYPVKYDSFDSISLSLPITHWGSPRLQDCLTKFVSCEQVSDAICESCCKDETVSSTSNSRSTFIKQLSFGKLPECLCFHIQRTVWLSNGIPAKCFDHMIFTELLCMDSFVYKCSPSKVSKDHQIALIGGSRECQEKSHQSLLPKIGVDKIFPDNIDAADQSQKNLPSGLHVYLLKAVIVHVGDLTSGHFVTYRRGSFNSSSSKRWFCTSDCSTKEVPFSEVAKVPAYMLFYEKLYDKGA